MRSRIPRRGAALTAAALMTLGLASAPAGANVFDLPPGGQVNDHPADRRRSSGDRE